MRSIAITSICFKEEIMKKFTPTILFIFLINLAFGQAGPFAQIDSKWNYWYASEYFSGFRRYEVQKDTLITAADYGSTEERQVLCSKIAIWNEVIFISTGDPNLYYSGENIIAYRDGDVAYYYDPRHEKFFKWIDMNAQPGDKWLFPEFYSSYDDNPPIVDYVEVLSRSSVNVNGEEIPVINMMPSCTSLYNEPGDFTSRIKLEGAFNIDFINFYSWPVGQKNGSNNLSGGMEINYGLLCAENGDLKVDMPTLEDYFVYCIKDLYEQGIIECDSLRYPVWDKRKQLEALYSSKTKKNVYPSSYVHAVNNAYAQLLDKSKLNSPKFEAMYEVPVVFHVVHNPSTPEEKISEEQIMELLAYVNEAYNAENDQSGVREVFKEDIGNPKIKFVLATEDPNGQATNGVEYIETSEDSFWLMGYTNQERYPFKYNEDETPNAWDNQKYLNVWIADLAFEDFGTTGFTAIANTLDGEIFEDWYLHNEGDLWKEWLVSEDGKALDGVTLDYFHTFGGVSQTNPDATFNSFITELGHFLGIRNTYVTMIETSDGESILCDDGFEDTPYCHYANVIRDNCDNEVRQCGNLVQQENFMDKSIACHAMFTKEQCSFMRTFLETTRPTLFGTVTVEEQIKSQIKVYPNPTDHIVNIEVPHNNSPIQIMFYDIYGKLCYKDQFIGDACQLSVNHLPTGLYCVKLVGDKFQDSIKLNILK